MKRIPWDWRLLKLVITSRGFLLKEVPGQLPEDLFPDRKGLAEKTLQGNVTEGKSARPDIAEYLVAKLPTRPGYEKTAKVVRLGLAAWRGESFRVIGKRLDAHGGKLDKLLTEVEAIRLAMKGFLHVATTTVLLVAGLGFAGHQLLRAGVISGETASATQTPPVGDTAKGATGAPGFVVYLRAVLGGVLDLGKKAEENWIPKTPYPGQKLEKDCDRRLGETPINGGCWVKVADMAPPCELLFRHGNACYRPVSADPNKPVGMFPGSSGQQ